MSQDQVLNRSGVLEFFSFDKITNRNVELAKDLNINVTTLSKIVTSSLPSNRIITTEEIDRLSAETAFSMSTYNPDYEVLASRIAMSNLHKSTSANYLTVIGKLLTRKTKRGKIKPFIRNDIYDFAKKHIDVINDNLNYNNDYGYSYFGIRTLEKSYLLKAEGKIVERPQHMLMRVALQFYGPCTYTTLENKVVEDAGDIDKVIECYHMLSEKKFSPATPILFNAGTNRPQLASCFILSMGDDLEEIYDTIKRMAMISKWSGGLGIDLSSIRPTGSPIDGTDGTSKGILPILQQLDLMARYVSQGGNKRPGSVAAYLQPWHPDILKFLAAIYKEPPEEERARGIFLGLWVPDLFMKRVKEDGVWNLFDPSFLPELTYAYGEEFERIYIQAENDKKYIPWPKNKDGVPTPPKARDLWSTILTCIENNSMPYMLGKDHINNKSNHKNVGPIRSSNLCVSGDTYILTDQGQIQIEKLKDQKVKVYNGFEYSEVEIKQTGEHQDLLKVEFSDGTILNCTQEHKFHVQEGYKSTGRNVKYKIVSAKNLKTGDKLIKWDHEKVLIDPQISFDIKYPYTHGFFCGDGTYHIKNNGDKTPSVCLYGEKKELLPYIEHRSWSDKNKEGNLNIQLPLDLESKFEVPLHGSIDNKIQWFEGYSDADGTIARNGTNESLQIASINFDFLIKVKLMLQTLGINSKVTKNFGKRKTFLPNGKGDYQLYECKDIWRLLVSSSDLYQLSELGYEPKRLKFVAKEPQRNASHFIKVVSVTEGLRNVNTFCFTEPKNHTGIFNGIITGQCTEIVEYTDFESIAVCNLHSLCLPSFIKDDQFDFEELGKTVEFVVDNMNRIIDRSFYPVKEARINNLQLRPIGIGVQGLANVFAKLKCPWESNEARYLNRLIFETIYYHALKKSAELAEKDGPYSRFEGSPMSQGILQYHMWNDHPWTQIDDDRDDMTVRTVTHGIQEELRDMDIDFPLYNWHDLIDKVKKGTRNSLLIAPMPTASTAQIIGNNESFEPFTSNIYVRSVNSGDFTVINKHLYHDLKELGLWRKDIVQEIILNNGSIQEIKEIPADIRLLYKTSYELPQKVIIDMAIDRGSMVDQSMSLNIYKARPNHSTLSSMYMYEWEHGLKTWSYYTHSKPAADAVKFTVMKEKTVKKPMNVVCTEEICTMCSS